MTFCYLVNARQPPSQPPAQPTLVLRYFVLNEPGVDGVLWSDILIASKRDELGRWPEPSESLQKYCREAFRAPENPPLELSCFVEAAVGKRWVRVGVCKWSTPAADFKMVARALAIAAVARRVEDGPDIPENLGQFVRVALAQAAIATRCGATAELNLAAVLNSETRVSLGAFSQNVIEEQLAPGGDLVTCRLVAGAATGSIAALAPSSGMRLDAVRPVWTSRNVRRLMHEVCVALGDPRATTPIETTGRLRHAVVALVRRAWSIGESESPIGRWEGATDDEKAQLVDSAKKSLGVGLPDGLLLLIDYASFDANTLVDLLGETWSPAEPCRRRALAKVEGYGRAAVHQGAPAQRGDAGWGDLTWVADTLRLGPGASDAVGAEEVGEIDLLEVLLKPTVVERKFLTETNGGVFVFLRRVVQPTAAEDMQEKWRLCNAVSADGRVGAYRILENARSNDHAHRVMLHHQHPIGNALPSPIAQITEIVRGRGRGLRRGQSKATTTSIVATLASEEIFLPLLPLLQYGSEYEIAALAVAGGELADDGSLDTPTLATLAKDVSLFTVGQYPRVAYERSVPAGQPRLVAETPAPTMAAGHSLLDDLVGLWTRGRPAWLERMLPRVNHTRPFAAPRRMRFGKPTTALHVAESSGIARREEHMALLREWSSGLPIEDEGVTGFKFEMWRGILEEGVLTCNCTSFEVERPFEIKIPTVGDQAVLFDVERVRPHGALLPATPNESAIHWSGRAVQYYSPVGGNVAPPLTISEVVGKKMSVGGATAGDARAAWDLLHRHSRLRLYVHEWQFLGHPLPEMHDLRLEQTKAAPRRLVRELGVADLLEQCGVSDGTSLQLQFKKSGVEIEDHHARGEVPRVYVLEVEGRYESRVWSVGNVQFVDAPPSVSYAKEDPSLPSPVVRAVAPLLHGCGIALFCNEEGYTFGARETVLLKIANVAADPIRKKTSADDETSTAEKDFEVTLRPFGFRFGGGGRFSSCAYLLDPKTSQTSLGPGSFFRGKILREFNGMRSVARDVELQIGDDFETMTGDLWAASSPSGLQRKALFVPSRFELGPDGFEREVVLDSGEIGRWIFLEADRGSDGADASFDAWLADLSGSYAEKLAAILDAATGAGWLARGSADRACGRLRVAGIGPHGLERN
jgi:hypothetical protein